MKKIYLPLVTFFFYAVGTLAQYPPELINGGAPHVVNFQQLAAFEATHPPAEVRRVIEQGEDREEKFKRTPKAVTGNVSQFDITPGEENTRSVSPSPNIVFNGWCPTTISLIPPDVSGSCGDSLIMETDNQRFDIYQRSGTHVSTLTISTFFSASGGSGYFDPHIYFDKNYHRYVVCIAGNAPNGNSGLFIAISQTSMPTGNWYVYGFDAIGNANDFLDYPLLGMNNKWIVMTGNDFIGSSNNAYSKIYVMSRATLYSGGILSVTTFTDQQAFTIAPAVTYDTTLANEYMVTDWMGDSANYGYVRIYQISGPVGSPVYSAAGFVGVNQPWDENPVGAPQTGAQSLEDGDTRIANAQFINGSLWFTHTVFLPSGNPTHDAVDWYQVNPASLAVQQFGRIEDATAQKFYFYPSIAVNTNNDALIGYSVSSSAMHPSAQYSFRQSTDAPNTFESGYLFKSGLNTYFQDFGSGRNRWGDFSFTCIDPANNSFWTFQEWANATVDTWATVIANVAGIACTGTPVAGTVSPLSDTLSCSGQNAVLTLSGFTSGFTGVDMNWEQSPDGVNGWTTVTGGSGNGTDVYTTALLNATTYYRCVVSCINSGGASTSNVVVIVVPGITSVLGDTSCSARAFTLNASGSGTLNWYDAPVGGNLVHTGSTFITPALSSTTTYYVSSTIPGISQYVGPVDNTIGAGSYFTNTNAHAVIFDVNTASTLVSVVVYSGASGNRTINLLDASANVLQTTTVNIPNGTSTVTINFPLTPGSGYQLSCGGALINLFRNSSGAVFPYTVAGGAVTITGNDIPDAVHYYYFYHWLVMPNDCVSPRVPVTALINGPIPSFTYSTTSLSVNFTNTSANSTSWLWTFGDAGPSSTQQNPSHAYSAAGIYMVTLIACNGICCDTTTTAITVIDVGISAAAYSSLEFIPNPSTGLLIIQNYKPGTGDAIEFYDMLGKMVFKKMIADKNELDISSLPKGIYFARLNTMHGKLFGKVIKQ